MSDPEHDFVLELTGVTELTDELAVALFEAGCDDATLSVRSRQGRLEFSRSAPTLQAAVLSAIRQVRAAKVGLDVLSVQSCRLVTLADIARRAALPPAVVRQYIAGGRGPGGFPTPDCQITDEVPLWNWCVVAHWLHQNGLIRQEELREAQELEAINTALGLGRLRKQLGARADEILGELGQPVPAAG